MDRSLNASIIEITRLAKHFNDHDVHLLTLCLIEQLHCENQAEYFCRVIKHISCSLSDESVGILRNKAIQLAEKQIFEPKSSQEVKQGENQLDITKSGGKNSFSVFQWVQRQYCDRLSRLPSNIIDHMASYLDKKQSVEFGYLNKQLYIESQKQSYLIKRLRCNDGALTISYKAMDRFLWKETNSFAYSTPYELNVGTPNVWSGRYNNHLRRDGVNNQVGIDDTRLIGEFVPKRALFTSPWFTKVLKRVKRIKFEWLSCLPFISMPVLFGINNSGKINNESNMIDCMEFRIAERDKITLGYINTFYETIVRQALDNKSARSIKNLVISEEYNGFDLINDTDHRGDGAKRLLIALGPLSHRISVYNGDFSIDYNDIGKILKANNNLKELIFKGQFDVKIIDDSIKDKRDINIENQLTTITRDLTRFGRGGQNEANRFVQFVKDLTIYGLVPQLKCCKIVCESSIIGNPNWYYISGKWDRETNPLLHRSYTKDVLDYLLSIETNSNVPPLVDKIVLKFDDIKSLSGLANILLYLIDKRKYFEDSWSRKTKIKIIQIEISVDERTRGFGSQPFQRFESINASKDEFFGFSKNEDYDIDIKQAKINLSQFDKKELGIIYQNVIHWFDRIWQAKKSREESVVINKRLILQTQQS